MYDNQSAAETPQPHGENFSVVFIGLSITSSWGNGHATTYRSLIKGLALEGVNVLFLEQDVPWYAPHRDLQAFPYARIHLYASIQELKQQFAEEIRKAEMVIVGSYVQKGPEVIDWVHDTAWGIKAFYDIDTPITYTKLMNGDEEYLKRSQIPRFDIFFSFSGGPLLEQLKQEFGAQQAMPLYCSVDETQYFPQDLEKKWDLGYLGTYSDDRQPSLNNFLLIPAQQLREQAFIVAGPQYPQEISWPANVERIEHIPPDSHCRFYNEQRMTLNITRKDMIAWGHSPSVRLFEAAASGTCILSDYWEGLEEVFLLDKEIFIVRTSQDVLALLHDATEIDLAGMRAQAVRRVLEKHTGRKRAQEFLRHIRHFRSSLSLTEQEF